MLNYLRPVKVQEIFNMVHFVVHENFRHHVMDAVIEDFSNEVDSVYEEELTYYEDSRIYVAKDMDGVTLGTIRVLKWNFVDPLPIQKIFNINPLDHIDHRSVNEVYHFGRLAIQKDVPSLQLFKKLIATSIIPVCSHKHNVAFAECDAKLFRVLTLLGIEMEVIGESIEYLGSETIPVLMTCQGLMDFHNQYWKSNANMDSYGNQPMQTYKVEMLS